MYENSEDWFAISDIDDFTNKARTVVYSNFGAWNADKEPDDFIDSVSPNEQDELDKVLSFNESLSIVKGIARKQTHKKTSKVRYLINEKLFADIIQDLNTRMVSNILNSLVNKGLVETGYDSDAQDFVFWVKDENKNSNPEVD